MPRAKVVVDVGPLADLVHGRPRLVRARGRELGIVRWGDAVYAVRNLCAHMGASLCSGTVTALTVSEDALGEVTTDPARPVVNCPWHGWAYDLGTGRSLLDPDHVRVKTYPVTVIAGRVLVEVEGS